MSAAWLNLGSLLLGLLAWLLGGIAIACQGARWWGACAASSISACATALFFQICYSGHLVNIGDWSALEDTSEAVIFAAAALLLVTVALNAAAVLVAAKLQQGAQRK